MTKRFIRAFETGQIRLRLLESKDLPTTLAWRNQDRVRMNLITSRTLTLEEHGSWFGSYASKDDDFVFLFSERQERSRPVGQVSLYCIDWSRKTAEFGRLMIGEERALHKGLATAAARAIVNLAFRRFRLEKLSLEVYESNKAAIAIYQKIGFGTSSVTGGLVRMALQADPYFRSTRSTP